MPSFFDIQFEFYRLWNKFTEIWKVGKCLVRWFNHRSKFDHRMSDLTFFSRCLLCIAQCATIWIGSPGEPVWTLVKLLYNFLWTVWDSKLWGLQIEVVFRLLKLGRQLSCIISNDALAFTQRPAITLLIFKTSIENFHSNLSIVALFTSFEFVFQ